MINKENVNEMASSFYTMGTASGNLIMPLLGGVIYDSFGGDIDPNIYITEERKVIIHFQKKKISIGFSILPFNIYLHLINYSSTFYLFCRWLSGTSWYIPKDYWQKSVCLKGRRIAIIRKRRD